MQSWCFFLKKVQEGWKKFQKRATRVIKIVKLLLYDEQWEGEWNSLKKKQLNGAWGRHFTAPLWNKERHWKRDQEHTPGRGMGHWQMEAVGGRFSWLDRRSFHPQSVCGLWTPTHRYHGCSEFAWTRGAQDKLVGKSFAEDYRMLWRYLVAGSCVFAMFLRSPTQRTPACSHCCRQGSTLKNLYALTF